jgi:sodium-coupled neutral amino acid transporter 11
LEFAGIVGAGIMGLPFALQEAGFVTGLLLLLAVALVTDYSLRLLARLSTAHLASSYQDLVLRAFGTPGFVLVEFAQFAFAFGALVAYMLIIKDTASLVVRDLLGLDQGWDPDLMLAGVASVVVLPICFLKTMASLSMFSTASMVGVLVMVVVVVVERTRVTVPSTMTVEEQYLEPHPNWLAAIGGFAFAFVCQHQLLLVVNSLDNASQPRIATVVHSSLGVALFLSATMAIAGYTIFFEFTDGDILKAFEEAPIQAAGGVDSVILAVTVARVCLTLNMALTYPAELMVCRHVIETAITKVWRHRFWKNNGAPVFDVEERERVTAAFEELRGGWTDTVLHVTLTVGLFGTSLGLALLVNDLGIVQELVGSVSAVLLAFVIPAAVHLKLGADEADSTGPCHSSKIWSFFLLLGGVVVFFAATIQILSNAFDGDAPLSDDPAAG